MRETRLESEIAEFFQSDSATPVGSGTAALLMILEAINVRGKKVIIPVLTCPNVALAVVAAGAKVIVADVSYDDYCISPESVRNKMEEDVRAVIAVDAFGYPADIDGLKRSTWPYGPVIVEDACQGYGGKVDGRALGGRGDIGAISFGYSKPLAMNGGGFVLTSSPDLAEAVNSLRRSFTSRLFRRQKNWIALRLMLKGEYRLLEVLSHRLDLLRYGMPGHVERRLPAAWHHFINGLEHTKRNLRTVRDLIGSIPCLEPFHYEEYDWLPWRYSFRATNASVRTHIRHVLLQNNIETTVLYSPVTRQFGVVNPTGELGNARRLVDRTINLRYQTTTSDTDRLVEQLRRTANSSALGQL